MQSSNGPTNAKTFIEFLSGGGEMGVLTRAYDWSKTSVGSFDRWPSTLKTTVGIILHTDFPMFLWWGPDMIQFYNDGYRPSLGEDGKHPNALGQKGKDCWPEIWDTISPLIENVKATGESFFIEDRLVPIFRNGKIEDVYWTFSYSAVIGENGTIDGVLVVCNETTKTVETIRKLEKSRQEMKESEERFRTMAEHTDILVALSDETSNAVYFNRAWSVFTGRSMKELCDFGWADLIHEEDRSNFVDLYLQSFEKRESWTGEFRMQNKEGEYRWLLAKGPVRFRPDGSFAGYISSSIDITERKQAEETLRQNERQLEELVSDRTNQLERSNQDLLQFAHVASHDLKEPVRKIKTYANLLGTEALSKLTEKENQYLKKILSAAERMSVMIDGVLNFSTISAVEKKIELVDLDQIIRDIENDLEIVINQKSAKIEAGKLPTIPGANVLIYQLFYNLLNNSLKFSMKDRISLISITSRQTKIGMRDYAEITIEDNGIGFEQQSAGRIFDTFARLNSKDQFEGTGLGLALCKKIVERHKGKIEAEGVVNGGAKFVVTLPLNHHDTTLS